MTPARVLIAKAEALGITLEAVGDKLLLVAPEAPTASLLHDLAGSKSGVLASLEAHADEAAERTAIMDEPLLPPAGTEERIIRDERQRATLAGLQAAARCWQVRAILLPGSVGSGAAASAPAPAPTPTP
jgi:hypothetical protein